ncbi:hypothetical protein [Nocardia acidivorans]|uniref:hypothetical protein n=1 Tax=Nocardia acidivorans TaxID=404580 RepID=UPI000831BED4|nr:hypothetical protein [Nocardia acidivorans]
MAIMVAGPRTAAFLPSKMNKNGTASPGSSFAPVQGWLADTSGSFPGSLVSGNEALVVQNAGGAVTISVSATWSTFSTATVNINITVNGSVVQTNSQTGASGTLTATWNGAVATGDFIRIEMKYSGSFAVSVTAGFVQVT